ncbi:MAG: ComEC/Rec2 family competence protein [Patescibacteria group bacterium]
MNYRLLWVVSGFFIGVVFRSFFNFGWAGIGLITVLALAFASQKYFILALICLGTVLGVARYEIKDQSQLPGNHRLPGNREMFEAVIIDEPDERENYVRYVVEYEGVKILITARALLKFEYGDLIKIDGKIKRVENFTNPDGVTFDWQSYLGKDEIYYEVAFPTISLIEHGHGNYLREKLFALKRVFLNKLTRTITEPEASLAGGLVVGAKDSLGKEWLDKFRQAGLIHMVVLSGYNLSIVALAVMWFFRKFLSHNKSLIAGIVAIILFAIMTGGSSTVLRASVMAILGYLAQATGRVSTVSRALVIAAFLMVLLNPKVLVFDTGFQLSFLATLGLIYLEPLIAKWNWIKRLPETILGLKFREIASATLGAQIAVLPLILYTFGNFSIYSFPVNLLVLPIVPTTMLLVFLTGLIGLFFLPLAIPFAWISYILLTYMTSLVNLVSKLPLANLEIAHFPIVLTMLLYAGLIYLVLKLHKKEEHLAVSPPSA